MQIILKKISQRARCDFIKHITENSGYDYMNWESIKILYKENSVEKEMYRRDGSY